MNTLTGRVSEVGEFETETAVLITTSHGGIKVLVSRETAIEAAKHLYENVTFTGRWFARRFLAESVAPAESIKP